MIVFDFVKMTTTIDGAPVKCMCHVIPAYMDKKLLPGEGEHYECRFLLRFIFVTFIPKDPLGKNPQYYEWDQIGMDDHMIEKYDEKKGVPYMYLFKDGLEVAKLEVAKVVQAVNTLGMTGYKDIMLRLAGEPLKTLERQCDERGEGQKVCPGLDFRFFHEPIIDPYVHTRDEPYLELVRRKSELTMGIGDVLEDLRELRLDADFNEGEIRVQEGRYTSFDRELRSVNRALKKATYSADTKEFIEKEMKELEEKEKKHRLEYKHQLIGMVRERTAEEMGISQAQYEALKKDSVEATTKAIDKDEVSTSMEASTNEASTSTETKEETKETKEAEQ